MNHALSFSAQAQTMLKSASSWAKFLAILGFINVFFVFTVAAGLMSFGTFLPYLNLFLQNPNLPTEQMSQAGFDVSILSTGAYSYLPLVMGIIYIIVGIIYLFPIVHLFRFGSNASSAIRTGNEISLEKSMSHLKSHYKFLGMFIIITFVVYIIIAVVGVIGGMFFGSQMM
ncbi:DUF5362 family protein [Bernardetia sp. ABR2-2B]|uniref:DUF5362 family protein n=1 Tax=Bernardetia sp. ABR2-2B TaxID=3127472 RepID=UPI0030CCE8AA